MKLPAAGEGLPIERAPLIIGMIGSTAPDRPKRKGFGKRRVALVAVARLVLGMVARAWRDTTAEPVVRRAAVALPAYPADAPPLTTVLISDIHVAGPDMPPARLARIVARINAQRPDLVLVAGDLVGDKRLATAHYSTAEAVAALAPAIATVVVPGNHDHWRDAGEFHRELAKAGAVVLANQARRFGPLVVGGLDDDFTGTPTCPPRSPRWTASARRKSCSATAPTRSRTCAGPC